MEPTKGTLTKPAYYTGVHPYSFRSGEYAEIIGIRMFNHRYGWRPYFMLLYHDGTIDYSPIEDTNNYVLSLGPDHALTP